MRPIKLKFLLIIFLFPVMTMGQAPNFISHRYFNNLDDKLIGGKWINTKTKTAGLAHSGDYVSKIYGTRAYSLGLETKIPSDLKKRNFSIYVHAMIRINSPGANNQLVITITQNDSIIVWYGKNVGALYGKPGQWVLFEEYFLVPRNIPPDSKIQVYVWNADTKSETDIDDLDIYINSVELPSFLPK